MDTSKAIMAYEIADNLGLSPRLIRRFMSGIAKPSEDEWLTLLTIADLMEEDVYELFAEDEWSPVT